LTKRLLTRQLTGDFGHRHGGTIDGPITVLWIKKPNFSNVIAPADSLALPRILKSVFG
jgi:hypothetical protein